MQHRLGAPSRVVLLLTLLQGCGSPPLFQAETVIHGDGSCDRTIWQPTDEMLPSEAARAEWKARWSRITPSPGPPAFVAERPNDNDRKYFVAAGSFRNPSEIPDHFRNVVDWGSAKGTGRLDRRYERRDYTFVIEHRWSETLTNIVTRDDFVAARDQFLEIGIPLLEQGLGRVYGPRYDIERLLTDLKRDGRRFLERAAIEWYEHSAGHRPEEELAGRLASLAGEFGLNAIDPEGKPIGGTDLDALMRRFARHRMLLGIRHREGGRLSDREVEEIISPAPDSPFMKGWENFWTEQRKVCEERLAGPLLRMFGLYNHPLGTAGTGNPTFAFSLRLPGELAETNGSRDGQGVTRWKFRGDRSFPDGYSMTARSIEIDRAAQQRILGRVPISGTEQALTLVDVARNSPELRVLLQKTRDTGESNWLDQRLNSPGTSAEEIQVLRRLLGRVQETAIPGTGRR